MIRSPHKLVDLDVIAQAFFKDIDSELHLQQRLQTYPNNHIRPIVNYILTRLPLIITGRPDVLENEIGSIEPIIDNSVTVFLSSNPTLKDKKGRFITKISKRETLVRKNIKLEIKKLFDYDFSTDSFTKKDQGAIAYRHAERLGVNSCPYCNCNFTFTIRTKRMKSRPQFDHFLNKDRYPYLALSFFNLIPSCALCNSGALKGTKPFSIKTHLHPFIEDIEGLYEFKTNIDAVDFLVNNAMFTLELQLCRGISKKTAERATASIEVFGLRDRYQFHKDIAGDILKKSYVYTNSVIESLYTSFKIGDELIFKSKSEVKELVMGNYLHPDSFHKRILSKLTKDVAEEFGLLI